MEKFKVFNSFGIKPSKSYNAAGWDFYIPNIQGEAKARAYAAFKKSYKKTDRELDIILNRLEKEMTLLGMEEEYDKHNINILHLFLCLDGAVMQTSQNKVNTFLNYYLIFNEDGAPGINLHCNDHVFINSGVKVALDKDVAGVFMNKSGKGNKGLDIRACVVDEDYSGFVHLSVAYTKDNVKDGKIFCGDKLTQMLLLPIVHKDTCEELDETTYDRLMADSKRGADGFGSTDKK